MNKVNVSKSFSLAGIAFGENSEVDGDVAGGVEVAAVPAAQPGVLTIRTNGTDGSLTMGNVGHGIITGARLDIYWNNGLSFAYGALVGVVAALVVPFTGAHGTALPIATTAVNVMVPVKRVFSFTGNNLVMLASYCDVPALFVYVDVANAELALDSNSGGVAEVWYSAMDDVNPLAGGAVISVFMSHGDPLAAHDLKAAFLVTA